MFAFNNLEYFDVQICSIQLSSFQLYLYSDFYMIKDELNSHIRGLVIIKNKYSNITMINLIKTH